MRSFNISYGCTYYAGTYSSGYSNVGRVVGVMRANYICRMANWQCSE